MVVYRVRVTKDNETRYAEHDLSFIKEYVAAKRIEQSYQALGWNTSVEVINLTVEIVEEGV